MELLAVDYTKCTADESKKLPGIKLVSTIYIKPANNAEYA